MATDVILPALGVSQDTGKVVRWLKLEGEHVAKGEPLAEIETDKATLEIDAPADGVLARVSASAGEDVPVGQVIALILSANEALLRDGEHKEVQSGAQVSSAVKVDKPVSSPVSSQPVILPETTPRPVNAVSALASRIATDHNVDLSLVKPSGKRIQKADVLTYLQSREAVTTPTPRLVMASPKARRLAKEAGKDIATINGSGPGGAVLAADVGVVNVAPTESIDDQIGGGTGLIAPKDATLSTTWRIMAEHTTQSWTTVPHFYLVREVNVSRLISWREHAIGTALTTPRDEVGLPPKVTYTDLLVKIVAAALRIHPCLNTLWSEGKVTEQTEINIGLAVAIEEGLVVPVIHEADRLGLGEIAQQRVELVAKAQTGKLRLQDISGGTFTISNLGMYNVDAFNAIINQPQVAILAVGRIVERVVAVRGQPGVQPMMVLTLSCDHRAVDGARGARFLDSIATLIEEPMGLLA
ncbi:MAG: 2-oxo acid dehydrogenase subunit E2 [Ktedonobacteraceae bacterium]|nr:2-oxo acid dehydrogenase subunit E2 [Ktedonobacteraceae bacterium]